MARRLIAALSLAAALAVLAAASPAGAAPSKPHMSALRTVSLGMGYIPSVQFAPFYVADQKGYYRKAGLKVAFNYALSPNLLQLVAAGTVDVANADGTDAIAAVAQGLPLEYVMAEYQRFPVALFALAKSGIHTVAGLRGKTIGVPGRYGATYVGLLAALHAAGLRPGDVTIRSIGYTQVESVAAGKVDAAVGYSVNEPVILARRGYRVTTLQVGDVANLVAPGLVVGRTLATHDPALVRAFVQATLHGLADTIADPHAAFAMARKVNGLADMRGRDVGDNYAVLLRAIDFWHGAATRAHGLGYADPSQWRDSTRILRAIGVLAHIPAPTSLYTNTFAAGAPRI